MTRELLRSQATLLGDEGIYDRPITRADCVNGPRPCGFLACRHHLAVDVNPQTGSIKTNHPHLELDELTDSCSLDVADRGEATLEIVAQKLNITRERVRQIEIIGLHKLKLVVIR